MTRSSSPRESRTRTLLEQDKAREPLPVVLTVVDDEHQRGGERAMRLSRGSCVVGAGSGADLLIDSESVSRAHARFSVVPEGVLVEDLKSRNGTFYLGQRIRSMIVSPGATLLLGETAIRIELDQRAEFKRRHGPNNYGGMVASSSAMRELFSNLVRLEGSLVSVLIHGESGTGKELIARALHENSSVSRGPFVAINCGALQANLARSELFGHKKGAFTGASAEHRGAFQQADGGTLFLDEIGDLPGDVQPMLLRALEERAVTPVGSTTATPVSVRVIAASHHNLEEAAECGRFREDLYYRLVVVRLSVPALRERVEDIPLLAAYFAEQSGGPPLPAETIEALKHHHWPGNVRELRHAVDCFLAVGQLPTHSPSRPPPERNETEGPHFRIEATTPYHEQKERVVQEFTRAYLQALLSETGHNVSQAARISGLERSYLNKLTKRFGLK